MAFSWTDDNVRPQMVLGFPPVPASEPQGSSSNSETPTHASSSPPGDVSTSIVPLLMYFYDMVISDHSSFGKYCRIWLRSSADRKRNGRSRDIYPLPLMVSEDLDATCKIDSVVLLTICNLGILALSELSLG